MILAAWTGPGRPGAVGATNGSHRVQPYPDSARPSQNVLAPRTPAGTVDETVRERLPEFPDIKVPLEIALAEAEKFAELAADRSGLPG
jgi:hypothetical protein